jgi:hypothetical protein
VAAVRTGLPALVAHADWSANAPKRWMACAIQQADGRLRAWAPEPVGAPESLFERLKARASSTGAILLGCDFPIGLPDAYARECGVDGFLELLPSLGQGAWCDFYHVAERPEQIHLRRPFYPLRPGRARQSHLLDGLGIRNMDELRRQCERAHTGRRAAATLFWTLGGQQVGKAAISGWRELLAPELRRPEMGLSIWPFSGRLVELLHRGGVVVAETYPGEFYHHLGVGLHAQAGGKPSGDLGALGTPRRGKRSQASRAANAGVLLEWARRAGVELEPDLRAAILQGFGPRPGGEDPFDAVVGLFGMLNVVLGFRAPGEPVARRLRFVEGWILGQA